MNWSERKEDDAFLKKLLVSLKQEFTAMKMKVSCTALKSEE